MRSVPQPKVTRTWLSPSEEVVLATRIEAGAEKVDHVVCEAAAGVGRPAGEVSCEDQRMVDLTRQQLLGPHVGGDGVEHDPDALGELVEDEAGFARHGARERGSGW